LTSHAKYDTACTIDERFERSWQPLKWLSIKNIYVPNRPTPPLKKYINLKGLPNIKFSCMRCQWQHMHDFCVRKSIISRRFRSRIQKGPKGESGAKYVLLDEKTEGRKTRDTVPLNVRTVLFNENLWPWKFSIKFSASLKWQNLWVILP
jgi:hypothetical protein